MDDWPCGYLFVISYLTSVIFSYSVVIVVANKYRRECLAYWIDNYFIVLDGLGVYWYQAVILKVLGAVAYLGGGEQGFQGESKSTQ